MKSPQSPSRFISTAILFSALTLQSAWATSDTATTTKPTDAAASSQTADQPATPPSSPASAGESASDKAVETARKQAGSGADKFSASAAKGLAAAADAIKLLHDGKKDEALEKLALASGQLDIAIAAEPDLALIPVAGTTRRHVLIAGAADVERDLNTVKVLLEDGQVQAARQLLTELHSDITVSIVALPVASYPAAIKQAAGLAADNQSDEALRVLVTAMNTLVEDVTVIPVPVIAAAEGVAIAEVLLPKDKAAAEEQLRVAADQLEVARLLGYTRDDSPGYETLKEKIAELREEVGSDHESAGLFSKLKDEFKAFFGRASKREADAKPAAAEAPTNKAEDQAGK